MNGQGASLIDLSSLWGVHPLYSLGGKCKRPLKLFRHDVKEKNIDIPDTG
jgi:hypothetical protein